MIRMIKTDLWRLLSSAQFYCAIAGVTLLYLYGGRQAGYLSSVYQYYDFSGYFSTAILVYAFCAVAFSGCFIEDGEHQSWLLMIQRKGLKRYVRSKVLVCFLSGIITMIVGVLLFALIMHTQRPLLEETEALEDLSRSDTFGVLIRQRTIWLYFICSASVTGMLGGIFSLLSAYLSLYEPHRLFAVSAPVVGFYFIVNFLTGNLGLPVYFNIWIIYGVGYSMFGNGLWNLLYALAVTAVAVAVLERLIFRKLRRTLFDDQDKALDRH